MLLLSRLFGSALCGPRSERCRIGCVFDANPPFIRVVPGGFRTPDPSPDPACCGRHVPVAGPSCLAASFSPSIQRPRATRYQSPPRPAGLDGCGLSYQASLAPVGTRPVSQNRQRAMRSLRANATIITRRFLAPAPWVRFSYH